MQRTSSLGRREGSTVAGVAANLAVLIVPVLAWVLEVRYPRFYGASVQEDQMLEWTTFWAFFCAALGFLVVAHRYRLRTGRLPWFSLGVGLFCLFVAMEEISWGQRLFGYLPPEYFLAENFQQELNLHNVFDTSWRKLTLKVVILGYGVLLPGLAMAAVGKGILGRLQIIAPPWQLIPSFLVTYLLYEIYPWSHTGEWVELMLGLCFLFVALLQAAAVGEASGARPTVASVVVVWLIVLSLGFATSGVSRVSRRDSSQLAMAARLEVEALRRDFLSDKVTTRCSLHKRLYTFVEKYGQDHLLAGDFAGMTRQGLAEARAEYLLDPWNSPYWIRDRCKAGRRVSFVYSFGPNRRRESTPWEILGDDIGAYIRQ